MVVLKEWMNPFTGKPFVVIIDSRHICDGNYAVEVGGGISWSTYFYSPDYDECVKVAEEFYQKATKPF